MLFRLTAYSLIFFLVTLTLPEMKVNIFKVVTGETPLTDSHLIAFVSIFIIVEGILYTRAGYTLKNYFYIALTITKALLVVGFFGSIAYARSERFDQGAEYIISICDNETIKMICEKGSELITMIPV